MNVRKAWGFLLLFSLILAGCAASTQVQVAGYVDLSERQPVPTPAGQSAIPLRVAVAAVISPQGTIESYTLLLRYLEERLNRPVELVQRRTYLEINDLVRKGEVDLAFVCTSAYIAGHDEFDMQLLVAPQVNGKTVYYSLLIVPADSPAQGMTDLRGKVFAFTDPISLSGRMYPTWMVRQLGANPETFFQRTFFTYSHDDAIQAVANRLADGAAVDSLVYEFTATRDVTIQEKVRVIHRSQPFGIPPVVVSPLIRPQLVHELQTLLLGMDQDEAGRAALSAIGVERFVMISDGAYNSVRSLLSDVNATR